ncbi:MAG: DUF7683 domain-containing protein [Pseudonocardia sp.]
MSWVIRGYERDGEKLLTEIQVNDLVREWFRSALNIAATDPMVDSFPIPVDTLAAFLKSLGGTMKNEKEEFFLDYDADSP